MEEEVKLAKNEHKESREASKDDETDFLREQLSIVVNKIGSLEEMIKEQNIQLPPPEEAEDEDDEESEPEYDEEPEDDEESEPEDDEESEATDEES